MVSKKLIDKIAYRVTKRIRKYYTSIGLDEKPYISPRMLKMVFEELESAQHSVQRIGGTRRKNRTGSKPANR